MNGNEHLRQDDNPLGIIQELPSLIFIAGPLTVIMWIVALIEGFSIYGLAVFERRPIAWRWKGHLVGYKALTWSDQERCWCSPNHPGCYWRNGFLRADHMPSVDNTNGIYVAKYFDHWQLYLPEQEIMLVAMLEPVVEHERGYRAAAAVILRKV